MPEREEEKARIWRYKIQEAIKLVYRDNDILYVGIHSLHRISKYKGKDNAEPKIYKLGSGAWQKLKQATKKRVKDIAKDLIALYARRMSSRLVSEARAILSEVKWKEGREAADAVDCLDAVARFAVERDW